MSSWTSNLHATIEFERLWQFIAVGAVGTAFDFAVLITMTELVGTDPVVSKLLAGEVAIVVMFVLNERWTFAEWGKDALRPKLRRLATSNLVRATGIGVATLVLAVLHEWYGVWYVWANAVGIAIGFLVNYTMENTLTWRTHR